MADTTDFGALIQTLYERRALTSASPRLIHSRWARDAQWIGHNTYQLYRYANLNAVTVPLAEGVTPAQEAAPAIATITMTPDPYGAWMGYTLEVNLQAFSPVVSQVSQILGRQAGLSVDTLVRTTLHAGATTAFSGVAGARGAVAAVMTYADVVDQMAELQTQDAMPLDGGSYKVIVHPYTLALLFKDASFLAVFSREGGDGSADNIRSGKVGRLFNFDFYVSSNAVVWAGAGAGAVDVYGALFIGGESYGMAGFTGYYPQMGGFDGGSAESANMTGKFASPIKIITRALGETGFDPLKQRGTIGWLLFEDDAVLNAAWIRSFEHAL